jgi:hypothetical protein
MTSTVPSEGDAVGCAAERVRLSDAKAEGRAQAARAAAPDSAARESTEAEQPVTEPRERTGG